MATSFSYNVCNTIEYCNAFFILNRMAFGHILFVCYLILERIRNIFCSQKGGLKKSCYSFVRGFNLIE